MAGWVRRLTRISLLLFPFWQMIQLLDHNTGPSRLRLGEQVASLLLDAIRLREYVPGQKLPSERELGTRLAVNRTAVREGLRLLENQRFIEVRRGKYGGAFVLAAPADLALERVRGKIDELRQLFEYREIMEPLAAAMAAERIGEADLARLTELHVQELYELEFSDSGEQLRAIDEEIHELIAAATKNQHVLDAAHEARLGLALGLDLLGRSAARRRESTMGHAEIIDALVHHDSAEAADAMERHAAATTRAVTEFLAARGIDLEAADRIPLWTRRGKLSTEATLTPEAPDSTTA